MYERTINHTAHIFTDACISEVTSIPAGRESHENMATVNGKARMMPSGSLRRNRC